MIVVLAGGVGAAKLLLGLSHVVPPEEIAIIGNTGDDTELFGLRICPDLDTIVYTLSGMPPGTWRSWRRDLVQVGRSGFGNSPLANSPVKTGAKFDGGNR
jgi:2-phospho-L-lactate transferase CofD